LPYQKIIIITIENIILLIRVLASYPNTELQVFDIIEFVED